jgi:hypothetical protein
MEDTRREDTTRTVERTRREVARMEVEDECTEKQASRKIGRTVDKMVSMAREEWNKIKGLLDGKRLVRDRDGSRLLLKEKKDDKEESEELMDEWEEQVMGGEVEVEIEEVGAEREEGNLSDRSSVKRGVGFDFLEGIPDEEKVKELEDKKGECKKRKRGSELAGRRVEIGETTGWRIREEESRNSEKWKREVGTWKLNEIGLSEKCK